MTPNPEQIQLLKEIAVHDMIAIRSGHSIGKSTGLAMVGLWWLFCFQNSVTICTAPTYRQLKDVLWKEYEKLLDMSGIKYLVNDQVDKIAIKGQEKKWHILARSCKQPENLAGYHADYLLYIMDEASGINPEVDATIEGALSQVGNKLIMAGNPTQISGIFYNAFHRDRGLYRCLHFNSEKSKLVSRTYIERMKKKYGIDSDIYRVRVLGDFPKGEPDTLIPLWIVEQSANREIDQPDEIMHQLGVDPARYGDDESVIAYREGNVIHPLTVFSGINTRRLTGEVIRIIKEIRKKGVTGYIRICVDETGIGAGVVDSLSEMEEEFSINIIGVNNGAKPSDEDMESEYYNLGAETWGEMKQALGFMNIPNDEELKAQICTRKYKVDPKGRIQLEKKEDMKKRGIGSPDRGDAVALAITSYQAMVVIEEEHTYEDNYINEITEGVA